MTATERRPAARVLGIDVDAVDMRGALGHVATLLQAPQKSYVCVTSVHGIIEAQRNPQLLDVYSASGLTIPDGMPLVWVGHSQGHRAMRRVTGPDLMLEVFRRPEFANMTHFLYGGREGIAEELRDRLHKEFPQIKIVGTYTPPFRDLDNREVQQFVATIAKVKPDIIWVGISCPRQELFMARYLPMLDTKLMFGVGAAFDFHTGHIRDCSEWIKRAGLQWLHRLMQDPKRLWRRYLRCNSSFIWHIGLQLLGLRQYPQKGSAREVEARRRATVRT